jgi:hypothetical protein
LKRESILRSGSIRHPRARFSDPMAPPFYARVAPGEFASRDDSRAQNEKWEFDSERFRSAVRPSLARIDNREGPADRSVRISLARRDDLVHVVGQIAQPQTGGIVRQFAARRN